MTRLTLSLGLLATQAAAEPALADPRDFTKDAEIEGYRVISLYLDVQGQPMGARFRHGNGMPVDIIRVPSVPQVSLNVATPPDSDKGEPHTQEHLILGKGKTGIYLNSLFSMSLADHTAATYADVTNYQFHTAADKETFYRLLHQFFKALIRPDYTDEEIRREVANLGVVEDPKSGLLRPEEKGTVYNEMVSTMEKSDSVNWYQMTPLIFGKDNPMARNQGGLPSAIREMTPRDIRRFHRIRYHFGSNMALIAALPASYPFREFLSRLNGVMKAVEPEALDAAPGCLPRTGGGTGERCARYPAIPPYKPAKGAPIVIGSYPGEDPNLPQSVAFSWKPLKRALSPRESVELGLLLSVLADGETSFLYRDLIDEKTRAMGSGATNVGSYFLEAPANVPMVFLSGLPPSDLTRDKLGEIRKAVMNRVRSLREARRRSPVLKELNDKAASLLSSHRRSALKFIDAPPGFGRRHSGISWHQHLDTLHQAPGFRKALAMTPWFDAVEKKLKSGDNFWESVILRNGLDKEPIVSAVRPDKSLLESDRKAKAERLKAHEARLLRKFGTKDAQRALARHKTEQEKKTAELKEQEESVKRPRFVGDPPLTLDEMIDWEEGVLSGPVRVVTSRFPSTPFTDVHVLFDLRRLPEEDLPYLPVLPPLLTELGATTRDGERLDYVAMRERWRAEIYGLSASLSENPRTGRLELSLAASGSGPRENVKAVEWLENCLFRADVSSRTTGRLRAVLRDRIRGLRQIFQLSEERWVRQAADAYAYQDDARWMSVKSPFTRLQHFNRVYFRLAGYPDAGTRALVEETLRDLARETREGTRARIMERIDGLASGAGLRPENPETPILVDFGQYLQAELAWLPEGSWRRDLARMIRQTAADLARDPAAEMRHMKNILSDTLTRRNARAALTGNPKDTRDILPALRSLAEALPKGKRPSSRRGRTGSVVLARLRERHPGLKRPVHVGLVNNSTKSGVYVLSAAAPSYWDRGEDAALDYLALEAFSGAAPHSFFMQTWAAGLAYSNGVSPSLDRGRVAYYAERCPDLTATMRFVTELVRDTEMDDVSFLDFAVANSFGDYRGAAGFSTRGSAMATDIADGKTPEVVRRFKRGLLRAALVPGALKSLRKRLPSTLGSVLIGYGKKMAKALRAAGVVIGPDRLLDRYADFLKENGEARRLIKLYPRDFWFFDAERGAR
ncbi:MAG: hypothetical protein ABII00_09380 [Elusimicrobiota bacterium]